MPDEPKLHPPAPASAPLPIKESPSVGAVEKPKKEKRRKKRRPAAEAQESSSDSSDSSEDEDDERTQKLAALQEQVIISLLKKFWRASIALCLFHCMA